MLHAAVCRDVVSRAGTPFAAEEEATDGSALNVAQLQGLLYDSSAPAGGIDRLHNTCVFDWCFASFSCTACSKHSTSRPRDALYCTCVSRNCTVEAA